MDYLPQQGRQIKSAIFDEYIAMSQEIAYSENVLIFRKRFTELCIISTALDVPKRIFAVLYVLIMGLRRCYKTTVFYIYITTDH